MNPETIKWLLVDRGLSYLTLATCACVIYDHMSTLNDEIELIWKRRKWTPIQYLFLINRYGGDAFQLANAYVFVRHIINNTTQMYVALLLPAVNDANGFWNVLGNFIGNFSGYLGMIVFVAMQVIMICRLSSMYSHQRKIVILLSASLAFEVIAMIIVQVFSNSVNSPIVNPAPDLHFCQQDTFPSWSYVFWIPVLLEEFLLLVMAIHLGYKYYRSRQLVREFRSSSMIPSLLFILLRDSIVFPFIGVAGCLFNLLIWARAEHIVTQISFTIVMFIPSIIGCRLILNLREAYYRPFEDECIQDQRAHIAHTRRNRDVTITRDVTRTVDGDSLYD